MAKYELSLCIRLFSSFFNQSNQWLNFANTHFADHISRRTEEKLVKPFIGTLLQNLFGVLFLRMSDFAESF
jgi:hypothetical protein